MSDIRDYEPMWGAWYVDSLIGEGSFGKVYKVRRTDYGKTYYSAVKILSLPQDKAEITRMQAEGLNTAAIQDFFNVLVSDIFSEIDLMSEFSGNSHIVSFEDHKVIPNPNEVGWDILIRMELLKSLTEHVLEAPLSTEEAVKLAIHMCRALELCARKRIIHRDIKPDNIFISRYGAYKLGDFGIARQIERTMSGLSKKGTYTYMAPEVFKGEHYGPSVDIYGLGIVLYSILNQNRTPFLPDFPRVILPHDRERAQKRRMDGEPVPLLRNVSSQLDGLVRKACAYNEHERFASPTEMRAALETLMKGMERIPEPCREAQEQKDHSPAVTGSVTECDGLSQDEARIGASVWEPEKEEELFRASQVRRLLFPQSSDGEQGQSGVISAQGPARAGSGEPRYSRAETSPGPENKEREESDKEPAQKLHGTERIRGGSPEGAPDNTPRAKESVSPSRRRNNKKNVILATAVSVGILALLAVATVLFYVHISRPEVIYNHGNEPALAPQEELVSGFGIRINSLTEIVLGSTEEAEAVLNELKEHYSHISGAVSNNISSVEFEEEVEIVTVAVQPGEIMTEQEALDALINGKDQDQPYINVVVEGTYEITKETDFDTETRPDANLLIDTTQVAQEGEKGSVSITYTYVSVNGVFTEQETLSEAVVKEPVKRIILQGTKPLASPDNPQPVSRGFAGKHYLQNYSGKVLNVDAYSNTVRNGTRLCIADAQGGYWQKYSLTGLGGNQFRIKSHINFGSENYHIEPVDQVASGVSIQVSAVGSGRNSWAFYDIGDGFYIICPSSNTNLALTAANGNSWSRALLDTYSASNTLQRWKLIRVD